MTDLRERITAVLAPIWVDAAPYLNDLMEAIEGEA